MSKEKKMGIGIVAGLAAVIIIAVVLALFTKRSGTDEVPVEADSAKDAFLEYSYMDMKENGSYLNVRIVKRNDSYAMVEKYRDVGGQYFYKVQALSEFDVKRFEDTLQDFSVLKEQPDMSGAYETGVIRFGTKSGTSDYQVIPLDITGYGVVDPSNSDKYALVSEIPFDCNRLMPVKELAERLSFDSGAEFGGYLQMVYDQVAEELYGEDIETLSSVYRKFYQFTLKPAEEGDPSDTYVLELACSLGTYDISVTESGYVYDVTQTATAEESDFGSQSITREVGK